MLLVLSLIGFSLSALTDAAISRRPIHLSQLIQAQCLTERTSPRTCSELHSLTWVMAHY